MLYGKMLPVSSQGKEVEGKRWGERGGGKESIGCVRRVNNEVREVDRESYSE